MTDTKKARLQIPYLGPDPAPSRRLRPFVQIGCGLAAIVLWARAALYVQLASLDRELGSTGRASPSLVRRIDTNSAAIAIAALFGLGIFVAVVIAEIGWGRARRPLKVRKSLGEAYVESPMNWVIPVWLRIVNGVAFGFGLFFSSSSSTTHPRRFHRYGNDHRNDSIAALS